jgi:cytoskeleton protein RodZ
MTKATQLTLDEQGELGRKRIHLREISGDADTPLESVGQDLRAARLRRGDDLATVSRSLKIRKDHLEALEEDRFEALPGRTYAVGFVRSYADYLGLDPRQSVERFKSEIAGRTETQPTIGPPPDTNTVRLPQGWVVLGVVVLALIVYGAYHLARSADMLLRQPVEPVPERIAPPPSPPVASHAALQRGAPGGSALPGTATPSGTVDQNSAAGAITLSPATSGLSTQSSAAPPPAQLATPAPPSVTAQALPTGQAYGIKNHNARVVLRARAATRVLVQGKDGTVYLDRILQPGDSYNVPNRIGLTLSTPNSGAVAIELDGEMMGNAGQASQMAEAVSLDPQAVADRYGRGNSR